MNGETMPGALRSAGAIGGKTAAKLMTKAERIARAKKAAAASAKVRLKKRRQKSARKASKPL